jgi:hypothetical protein
MPENKLPEEFKSIAEIQNFWDARSSADNCKNEWQTVNFNMGSGTRMIEAVVLIVSFNAHFLSFFARRFMHFLKIIP